MRQLVPFIAFYSTVILFFGLITYILLRFLHRSWWKRRWVRIATYFLPLAGILSLSIIGFAEWHEISWMTSLFAPLATLALILEFAMAITLPFSGVINLINRLFDRIRGTKSSAAESPVDRNRRIFLKGAATAVPLVAIGTAGTGFARAYERAKIVEKEFLFANLPPALDGLKILQVSDTHLRQYVTLDDLEAVAIQAEAHSPDLVLVTGDVADDLGQLPGALSLYEQLRPRYGCYATLGNHEYFRGVERVKRIFEKSTIPLLVDQNVKVEIGDSTLFLAGIDDPVSMRSVDPNFFRVALDVALDGRGHDDFTVVMSHRPGAFPHATEREVDLTFAGHTHGGQIGIGGRSVWETYFPESYLWGHYIQGESQLYTTCGAGHWFPFRLGCPCEAPLITLHRA